MEELGRRGQTSWNDQVLKRQLETDGITWDQVDPGNQKHVPCDTKSDWFRNWQLQNTSEEKLHSYLIATIVRSSGCNSVLQLFFLCCLSFTTQHCVRPTSLRIFSLGWKPHTPGDKAALIIAWEEYRSTYLACDQQRWNNSYMRICSSKIFGSLRCFHQQTIFGGLPSVLNPPHLN